MCSSLNRPTQRPVIAVEAHVRADRCAAMDTPSFVARLSGPIRAQAEPLPVVGGKLMVPIFVAGPAITSIATLHLATTPAHVDVPMAIAIIEPRAAPSSVMASAIKRYRSLARSCVESSPALRHGFLTQHAPLRRLPITRPVLMMPRVCTSRRQSPRLEVPAALVRPDGSLRTH